jgi:hypothetical protein
MKLIKRGGEWWQVRLARRGWTATCDALDMRVTAATEAALMAEINFQMEILHLWEDTRW